MPRVFRQQYTRPIPEGAEHVTIKGKKGKTIAAVRFKGADGKMITAPVTTKAKQAGRLCRVPSPLWYGHVPDPDAPRGRRRVPLCIGKSESEHKLSDLIRQAERVEVHIDDQYTQHRQRPLREHVEDYRLELEARGNEPRYVRLVVSRLNALCDGCGFASTADLSASRVMVWLANLRRPKAPAEPLPELEAFTRGEAAAALGLNVEAFRDAVLRHRLPATGKGPARRFPRATVEAVQRLTFQGHSVRTTNYYLSHFKSFCRWLLQQKRLDPQRDPREQLTEGNVEVDHRHDRRELTTDELCRLLAATRASPRVFRGLSGGDRFHLYATACGTGYRAGGLASLTPERFSLDHKPPVVYLSARRNKSRVPKVQPLAEDLTALLRA